MRYWKKNSTWENKIEDLEHKNEAKQRQLDRLVKENELLLEQIDTYSSQLKVFVKANAEAEEKLTSMKEEKSAKEMELEAYLICYKENEGKKNDQLLVVDQELSSLRKDLKKSKESNLKLDDDCILYNEKVISLTEALHVLQEQQKHVLDNVKTSEVNATNLQKDLEECKSKSKDYALKLHAAKVELGDLEVKNKRAEEEVSSLQQQMKCKIQESKVIETQFKGNLENVASKLKTSDDERLLLVEKVEHLNLHILHLEDLVAKEEKKSEKAQKIVNLMKAEHTRVETQVDKMKLESEANILDLKQKLKIKEEKLANSSKEFKNYKVRAQTVLKQSKEKSYADVHEFSKEREEFVALENMNAALISKLGTANLRIKTILAESKRLEDELEETKKRSIQFDEKLLSREQQWSAKFEEQEDKIRKIEDRENCEKERLTSLMNKMLEKKELETEFMKRKHEEVLSNIKQDLDNKSNEVIRLELKLSKERRKKKEEGEEFDKQTETTVNIDKLEREISDGEDASVSIHTKPPLPLDQLLAQNVLHDNHQDNDDGKADRQVSHLAALLSEAEDQNSRLEKLTEVLKEEIRTYQRSEERYKHIENLEYVKNVFLKFLTLSKAQERIMLIPVLRTILKLKKEETDMIEELVRAEDSVTSGGEGWGKYLSMWPAQQ